MTGKSLSWRAGRFCGPGAFRIFLALLVVLDHFSRLRVGLYAVYVFFILSGFWVHQMWTARYSKVHSPYRTFVLSRLWRLGPVMLLASAVTIPLLAFVDRTGYALLWLESAHLLVSTLVFLGYNWLSVPPVGPAWSLDIEVQFYVAAPFIIFLIKRIGTTPLLISAGILSLISTFAIPIAVLPSVVIFFVLGLVSGERHWHPSGRVAMASLVCGLGSMGFLVLSPWRSVMLGGSSAGPLSRFNPEVGIVAALLTLPFAIWTTRQKSDSTDRMLGDLSYVIYLLHWIAAKWFFSIHGPFSTRAMVAGAGLSAVMVGSWLVWRYIDRPLNLRRARWVQGRMPDPAPPARVGAAAEPALP